MKKVFLLVSCFLLVTLYPADRNYAKGYKTVTYKKAVAVTHSWKLVYKKTISKKTVTSKTIYMTEYNKKTKIPLTLSLSKNKKTIKVKPKKALKAGRKYVLIIKNIKTTKNKLLANPAKKVFTTLKAPIVKKPEPKVITPAISESVVKTTNQIFKADISEKKNRLTVTYNLGDSRDSDIILQTSLSVKEDYKLTFTKIPAAASLFISDDYSQSLKKGHNNLHGTEKMKENHITIGLIRLTGDYIFAGVLTNSAGVKQPFTLVYNMK